MFGEDLFNFCRDQNNPMNKKFSEDLFFYFLLESTSILYIRKYFVLNIRADSSCPPPPTHTPNCFAVLQPWRHQKQTNVTRSFYFGPLPIKIFGYVSADRLRGWWGRL